jgi:hypothetical protein
LLGLLKHAIDIGALGYICLNDKRAPALCANRLCDRFCPFARADVANHNIRTFLGKDLSDTSADALPGTCNQSDLSS